MGSLLLVIFFLFAFTVVGNMIGGPFTTYCPNGWRGW